MNYRKTIPTVAVALRLSFASHRDILYGISTYARIHHWKLQLIHLSESFNESMLHDVAASNPDGIITSDLGSAEWASALSTYPLVYLGPKPRCLSKRKTNLSLVHHDDNAIGQTGARFLRSLGRFASFGFLTSNRHNHCSILRLKGFRNELARQGIPVSICSHANDEDGSASDLSAIASWLAGLPKPSAVMAVYDFRAVHLLEAASRVEIKIPDQLAVLGVDNDELLCDFTEPKLTSIAPDYVKLGVIAAEAISGMLAAKRPPSVTGIRSRPTRIVERESTRHIPPATQLVAETRGFIDKHIKTGIGAKDVIRHLGVSRRLAETRFSDATGMSILQFILDKRLEILKHELLASNAPISKITSGCGFTGENYVKNLFRRKFGMSMRDFRRAHST